MPVEAEYAFTADRDEALIVFCSQIAAVEVEEETSDVVLKTFTTAHDMDTILNSISHQGHIAGAVMQGIGYAMVEKVYHAMQERAGAA